MPVWPLDLQIPIKKIKWLMARNLGDCSVSTQRNDVKLGDFKDDSGLDKDVYLCL